MTQAGLADESQVSKTQHPHHRGWAEYINHPQIIFEKQKGTFRWLFLIVLKSSKTEPDKERNPRMEVGRQLTPAYETAPNDQR